MLTHLAFNPTHNCNYNRSGGHSCRRAARCHVGTGWWESKRRWRRGWCTYTCCDFFVKAFLCRQITNVMFACFPPYADVRLVMFHILKGQMINHVTNDAREDEMDANLGAGAYFMNTSLRWCSYVDDSVVRGWQSAVRRCGVKLLDAGTITH